MQGILNLVWQHLLPAMTDQTLATGATAQTLQSILKALSLPIPQGRHFAAAKSDFGQELFR